MKPNGTVMIHYSAPPTIGGVEAVIDAHTRVFREAGQRVGVIAGRGEQSALAPGVEMTLIPELDSQNPVVVNQNQLLEKGEVPADFNSLVDRLQAALGPIIASYEYAILHNIFTKHFNLAATAALFRLLESGEMNHCLAWCHDISWTSEHSRPKVHPGYPWDLLRTYRPEVTYVAVSQSRRRELAELYSCPADRIKVIYNGVDPEGLLGLSQEGAELAKRLGLFESDLVLLMPVRVTQAKNIEFALRCLAAIKTSGFHPRLVITGPPDPHDPESIHYYRRLLDLRRELDVEHEMHFIYESGPDPGQPFIIDSRVIGDLFRLSDLMFMPSHREGFGMPVLEAGLVGIPVITTRVPAAVEIGGQEVLIFESDDGPERVAGLVLDWAEQDRYHRLRRKVRQNYTWQALFRKNIKPLLEPG